MLNGRGIENVGPLMHVFFYTVSSRLSEISSTVNYSKPNALDLRTFGWLMAMSILSVTQIRSSIG
jgi:hypothetical protein